MKICKDVDSEMLVLRDEVWATTAVYQWKEVKVI